jgi:hypothetical protein
VSHWFGSGEKQLTPTQGGIVSVPLVSLPEAVLVSSVSMVALSVASSVSVEVEASVVSAPPPPGKL